MSCRRPRGLLQAIVAAGADAVIVQDLGLARLIQRVAPGLTVHGSTQMTLTEARGIEFVRRLGVQRVIVARELSAAEIGRIREMTPMPLEVFVHGALCVSYSGQCLTSEALGGRSANRGQCAQACRLPYELVVDGQTARHRRSAILAEPAGFGGARSDRSAGEAWRAQFQNRGAIEKRRVRGDHFANVSGGDRCGRRRPAFCTRASSSESTCSKVSRAASVTAS